MMLDIRQAALSGLLALAACGPSAHRAANQGQPVLELARHATAPNANGSLNAENALNGVARVKVEGQNFEVAARTAHLERFPCARCHDRPVEQMRIAAKGKKAAHWEIRLRHAPEGVMSCESCHVLAGETNTLRSLRGEPVAFDHAYQTCAQCHSRQAADWVGGAHGKRLGGWAPPRVVQNCTGCHDPHSPRLESRWPALSKDEQHP